MILITEAGSPVCVCKDVATAFDYLRTISGNIPLRAKNFIYGIHERWQYDGESGRHGFDECEKSPFKWMYLIGQTRYYLSPIDYID